MRILYILIILSLSLFDRSQTYKFYQTDNINNQLRLNTKTGEVYQIHNDGQKLLVHAESTPNNEKPNRNILHKTQNMWTYILLDKFTGKLWQFKCSVKGVDYISSWVINSNELSNSETNKFTIQPLTRCFNFIS